MKLAMLYTVWTGDDMEMLQRSIKQHAPHVDEVLIFSQNISNTGNDGGDYNFMASGYSENVGWIMAPVFKPDLSKTTKENERIKHDFMIQYAKKQGFTHFIMSACDHFYAPEQLNWAKEYHEKHDIDVSFTMMRTYYKQENWYLDPMEYYYMPLIHKMSANTAISNEIKYPLRLIHR